MTMVGGGGGGGGGGGTLELAVDYERLAQRVMERRDALSASQGGAVKG